MFITTVHNFIKIIWTSVDLLPTSAMTKITGPWFQTHIVPYVLQECKSKWRSAIWRLSGVLWPRFAGRTSVSHKCEHYWKRKSVPQFIWRNISRVYVPVIFILSAIIQIQPFGSVLKVIWCDVTCRWNSQAIFVFSGPESWFPPMFSFFIPVSCHSLLQLVWNSIFSWCHHSERVFMFYPAWVEVGQAALCLLLLSVSSQNSANTSYRDLTLRAVNCGAGFECVVPLLFSQQIQALWQQPSSSATPVTNSPTMCTLKNETQKRWKCLYKTPTCFFVSAISGFLQKGGGVIDMLSYQ